MATGRNNIACVSDKREKHTRFNTYKKILLAHMHHPSLTQTHKCVDRSRQIM